MKNYLELKISESCDLIDEGNVVSIKIGKLFRESEDKFILTWNNGKVTELTSENVRCKQWLGDEFYIQKEKGIHHGYGLYQKDRIRNIYRNTIPYISSRDYNRLKRRERNEKNNNS